MKYSGILLIVISITACQVKPRPIVAGTDECSYCRMTVVDTKSACEFVTDKGKYFVFDDFQCMRKYLTENPAAEGEKRNLFVTNYFNNTELLNAENAIYFSSPELHTPMNGNIVAIKDQAGLEQIGTQFKGESVPLNFVFK